MDSVRALFFLFLAIFLAIYGVGKYEKGKHGDAIFYWLLSSMNFLSYILYTN